MAFGDYTGQKKASLATEFAEQQVLAAKSKTLVTQVVEEGKNEPISLLCDKDYENLANLQAASEDGEVTEVDVENPQFQVVRFQSAETLDEVTVGQGRQFSLKAGHVYEAPRWVAEHLDTQGIVARQGIRF